MGNHPIKQPEPALIRKESLQLGQKINPFLSLPTELISKIFYLYDCSRVTMVCKVWYEIYWKSTKSIFYKKNTPPDVLSTALCQQHISEVIELKLERTQITGDVLKIIVPHLTKLTNLSLAFCASLTSYDIRSLSTLTNITNINLNSCYLICNRGLLYLRSLINLEQLNIRGCGRINNDGFKDLTNLTNLKNLNLSFTNVSDFETMSTYQSLESLNISSVKSSITNSHYLTQLVHLTALSLRQTSGADCFHQVLKLTNLKKLNLSNIRPYNQQITGLSVLTNLVQLSITTTLSPFEDLSTLKQLELLDACGCTSIPPTQRLMEIFPSLKILVCSHQVACVSVPGILIKRGDSLWECEDIV